MASSAVRHDRLTQRLGELDRVRNVLGSAGDRLGSGWTQGRWRDVDGVCLVSAIRLGGRGNVTSRAIDVTWHALHDDPEGVRWLVPPAVRQARVRDLTRWNDRPGRLRDDVLALLATADGLTLLEAARLRTELGLRATVPA